MNESELIERTAAAAGVSKPMAKEFVEKFKAAITDEIARGGCVKLCGMGEFRTKNYPARVLRNPQTGQPVNVPARRVPAFTVSKAWKAVLNAQPAVPAA